MESLIGLILIIAIVISIPIAFGKIGSNIAKNNGAKASSGFWFGFWLGPIGLVIAALLKPTKQSEKNETIPLFSGPESLDNDSYKIWLVRTYRIEKNDAMESFICDDRIFSSFEEAIKHAHSIEQSEWTHNGEIESSDIQLDLESSNSEIDEDLTDFESSEKSEIRSEPRQSTMVKSWRTEIAAKKDMLLLAAFTIAAVMAVLAFWLLSPTPAEQCQKRSLEQTESCLLGADSVEGIMACYNASNTRQERCGKTRAQIRAEAEGTSPGGPVEEAPAVDAAMRPRIETSSPVEEAPAVDADQVGQVAIKSPDVPIAPLEPRDNQECQGFFAYITTPEREVPFSVEVERNSVEIVWMDYSPTIFARKRLQPDGSIVFYAENSGGPSTLRCSGNDATLTFSSELETPRSTYRLVRSQTDIFGVARQRGWPVGD
jgi:hypothetical protein